VSDTSARAVYTTVCCAGMFVCSQGALAACNVDMDIRDCNPEVVPGTDAASSVLFDFCVGDR
jgi:hypothetical protein